MLKKVQKNLTEVETQSSTETSSAETESDVETTSAGTTETETEGSTESTSTKPTETETESSTESTSTKPTETETEDNTESNTSMPRSLTLCDVCLGVFGFLPLGYRSRSCLMPHKVNPIDFENAEGNLGIATSILEHLAVKLPVSRLQRDLTDSTVLRNVGVPFGHIVIAIQSSLKGLRKLLLNEPAIYRDLDNCWSVVAEAIQTILRREAYPHPYEALKALTRTNQAITESSIKEFIEELNVSEDIKKELRAITPHTYTGL